MSLIAWYKLDGNALDSSGNGYNLTTNTATPTTAGKIGGCYTFASGNAISATSGINLPHDVSFTAWAYNSNAFAGNMMIFSCNSTLYSGPDLYFTGTIAWNTGDGAVNPFKKNGVNVVYPSSNAWHHYAVVNNQELNKTFLYIDGEYYGEAIYRNTFQENRGFTIGNYTPGSTGYAWRGMIDDVRIYNHVLSTKEIKELAKAKVLHYTFDDFQEPTENLLVNGDSKAGTSNWSLATNGTGNFSITEDSFFKITIPDAGKYYYLFQNKTISIPAGTDINFSAIFKNNVVGTFALRFVGFVGGSAPLQPMIKINLDGTGGVKKAIINTKYSVEALTSIRADVLAGSYYGLSNITLEVTDLQVELKDHATPFVNGIRTGSITDSSGYDNHADLALATTPQWVEDSRIGSGAYYFDGSKELVTNKLFFDNINQEWTATGWVKLDVNNTYQQFNNFNLGNRIIHSSLKALLYANNGVNDHYVYSSSTIPTNQWVHIAFVYRTSDRTCKFYLNGNLDASSYNYSATDVPSGFSATTIFGTSLQGYMDDVRIYATALSADDVRELYQTRASLDNRGNFFAGGFTAHIDAPIDNILIVLIGEGMPLESSFLITDIHGGI